jgi:hypothetical protein
VLFPEGPVSDATEPDRRCALLVPVQALDSHGMPVRERCQDTRNLVSPRHRKTRALAEAPLAMRSYLVHQTCAVQAGMAPGNEDGFGVPGKSAAHAAKEYQE